MGQESRKMHPAIAQLYRMVGQMMAQGESDEATDAAIRNYLQLLAAGSEGGDQGQRPRTSKRRLTGQSDLN